MYGIRPIVTLFVNYYWLGDRTLFSSPRNKIKCKFLLKILIWWEKKKEIEKGKEEQGKKQSSNLMQEGDF